MLLHHSLQPLSLRPQHSLQPLSLRPQSVAMTMRRAAGAAPTIRVSG